MTRHAARSDEKNRSLSLSVVIPVYNEEQTIDALVSRCVAACEHAADSFELILVDDGSIDCSARRITEAAERFPGIVTGVLLNRNCGQHAAVMAGFEQAGGETIVTLDADLQNPPEEIPRVVQRINEGADVVGTVRVPRHDSLFRRMSSSVINRTVRRATGVLMHDYGCMLRAYRRPVVNAMLQSTERSTFIPILANYFAHSPAEIEVRHESRPAGNSRYSLWKLVNLQFDLLTSMTTFPLRMLSVLGVIAAAMGIGFGVFLMVMRLAFGSEWAAGGVFTLFAILFTFVGAQFIGLGLLGEYIGRIYHDVRARPRYCVREIVRAERPATQRELATSSEVLT
jgi:undecaprenyl-phosphate 4-deoxy-4-formamido-L-arabinose transferase